METSWLTVLRALRLADMADVLLVASLLFFAIHWLRRSRSGSAAQSILVLGLLYALLYGIAGIFNLYLLTLLLQVLLFLVLISLVVVFQSDIRHLLDQIARWRPGRPAFPREVDSPVSILLEAGAELANQRTGALIALKGSEPWDSYIQGGVPLNGIVSLPLLMSIFQEDTPGHDGALLMTNSRVSRFAAHLPLAARLPEESRFGGTRHAAALGLAERCDAFVIVISEERGTISVAENGTLQRMQTPDEFSERLHRFWREHHTPSRSSRHRLWNRQILTSALMALGISSLAWLLLVFSADTLSRTYQAPLEIVNLPPTWHVGADSLPSVRVTLTGPEPAFNRLDEEKLRVSFNLEAPRAGWNELVIDREHLRLPSGVRLANAEPPSVRVWAERQRLVELPVRVRLEGSLPDSLRLEVEPKQVQVRFPARQQEIPAAVWTEPVRRADLASGAGYRAPLVLPEGARLGADENGTVELRLVPRGAPGAADILRMPGGSFFARPRR